MVQRRPLIINSGASQIQELTDSDSLIGNGTIPLGGIIMWSGSIADITNLSGWALCDGNSGNPINGITIPDLRNRFVVGAFSDGANDTWPNLAPNDTGGSANAVIVEHRHAPTTSASGTDDSVDGDGNPINQADGRQIAVNDNVVGNYGGGSGTGLGPLGTRHFMENEGVSGTNKNLPPYFALAFIIRTL